MTDQVQNFGLRETLSKLEHEQWQSWINYCIDNYDLPEDLVEKWRSNDIPYSDLSEEEKDKDRKYADKTLNNFTQLSEEQRWTIVENLMNSELELRQTGYVETADMIAELLDEISPNWRTADSCRTVETREILIFNPEEDEHE